jgi:hypothetical protein
MDFQGLYWLVGIAVAVLTVYNTISNAAHKRGSTDAQIDHQQDNEKAWNVKFDALDGKLVHYELRTNERIENMLKQLNEALLYMAREHPTKNDLQTVKTEILARIDSQYGEPMTRRRGAKTDG